ARVAGLLTEAEVLAVARSDHVFQREEDVANMDAPPSQQLERIRVPRLDPDGRVRLLQRAHRELEVLIAVVLALKGEGTGRAERRLDEGEGFLRDRPSILVVCPVRHEVIGSDARDEAELQTPAQYVVQDRGFLND